MFYKFFCMTHPNRGGHTQKTEKPDFRIRMNRDWSEKKITYIKRYYRINTDQSYQNQSKRSIISKSSLHSILAFKPFMLSFFMISIVFPFSNPDLLTQSYPMS